MRLKHFIPTFLLLTIFSSTTITEKTQKPSLIAATVHIEPTAAMKVSSLYNNIQNNSDSMPNLESFSQAIAGFYDLKTKGVITKNILTIIDFSLSSTIKRLWVIDLSNNTVLLHSVVAHGINSGLKYANSFSNAGNSNKSCLGFFATGESYIGKNGLSLKLDGLEKGVNDHARSRAVVVHGASYANSNILNSQNYLGRSQGCPAVPEKLNAKLIAIIKEKSCLFIYHLSRDLQVLSRLVS